MSQPNRIAELEEAKEKYNSEVEASKRRHPNDEIPTFEEWLENQ